MHFLVAEEKFMWFQVYHSSFVNEEGISKACGCPLLPLKSHIKGPAPVSDQGSCCLKILKLIRDISGDVLFGYSLLTNVN